MTFSQRCHSSLLAPSFDVAFALVVGGQHWGSRAASAVRWMALPCRQLLSHCCSATAPSQAVWRCCCRFVDIVVVVVVVDVVAVAFAFAGVADAVRCNARVLERGWGWGLDVSSVLLHAHEFCPGRCYCVRLNGRHACREMLIFATEWKRRLLRWLAWSAGRRRCVEQWAQSWFASPRVAHLKECTIS